MHDLQPYHDINVSLPIKDTPVQVKDIKGEVYIASIEISELGHPKWVGGNFICSIDTFPN